MNITNDWLIAGTQRIRLTAIAGYNLVPGATNITVDLLGGQRVTLDCPPDPAAQKAYLAAVNQRDAALRAAAEAARKGEAKAIDIPVVPSSAFMADPAKEALAALDQAFDIAQLAEGQPSASGTPGP